MKIRAIPLTVAIAALVVSVPEAFSQRGRGAGPRVQNAAPPAAVQSPQRSTFTYIPRIQAANIRKSNQADAAFRQFRAPIISYPYGYPYVNYPYSTYPYEPVVTHQSSSPSPELPIQYQEPAPHFAPAAVPASPDPPQAVREVVVAKPETRRRPIPPALVVGMARAEVLQILGSPQGTARWSTNETLFFDGGPSVVLRDGKVTEIR